MGGMVSGAAGEDGVMVLRAEGLTCAGFAHGFSTRVGGCSTIYGQGRGELNVGFTSSDSVEQVRENRRRLVLAVCGEPRSLVTLRQVHGAEMLRVGVGDAGEGALLEGDGLMTDAPGVVLGIQTADCVPVLVADRRRRAVAAMHAGWRGTVAGMVQRGVRRMQQEFGSDAEDLVAAVGPAIGPCCYCVGEEVRAGFVAAFGDAETLFVWRLAAGETCEQRLYVDLQEANRRQLVASGLRAEAVDVLRWCTRCRNDLFFSYRAEKGFTGRMLALITL